jgi:hypothetical protein
MLIFNNTLLKIKLFYYKIKIIENYLNFKNLSKGFFYFEKTFSIWIDRLEYLYIDAPLLLIISENLMLYYL